MSEPRLTSSFQISALIAQAQQQGIFPMVVHKGDEHAGSIVWVLYNRAQHYKILTQTRTMDGQPAWMWGTGQDPITARQADEYIARHLSRDSDIWIVESMSDLFIPPFQATIL